MIDIDCNLLSVIIDWLTVVIVCCCRKFCVSCLLVLER